MLHNYNIIDSYARFLNASQSKKNPVLFHNFPGPWIVFPWVSLKVVNTPVNEYIVIFANKTAEILLLSHMLNDLNVSISQV